MLTAAKRLHDLLDQVIKSPAADNERTGVALATISRDALKRKDEGAQISQQISSLLVQIEEGVMAIPGIKDYHKNSYLSAVAQIRRCMAPGLMLKPWGETKHLLQSSLSSLIMLDHAIEASNVNNITKEELEQIAIELEETQAFVNDSSAPDHVRRLLSLEIEKLKILIRSDVLWDEQKFLSLYAALSTKILAVSELFNEKDKGKVRQRFSIMFTRIRSSVGLTADTAQLTDVATKLISGSSS